MHELFLRGSSVLGMGKKMAAEILHVLDLNPNPSNLEGFGTPASFSGAWTKHWCRVEGLAARQPQKMSLYLGGARVGHPTYFDRYTISPATMVHNTFVSRISSGEIVRTSRSSKIKSARLPAAISPMESRFIARAEFRV